MEIIGLELIAPGAIIRVESSDRKSVPNETALAAIDLVNKCFLP